MRCCLVVFFPCCHFRHFRPCCPFGCLWSCSALAPFRTFCLVAILGILDLLSLSSLYSPKITKPRQLVLSRLLLSGGCLLSHLRSTIGVTGLNFSVRDGKRWIPGAITTLIRLQSSLYSVTFNIIERTLFDELCCF